MLRDGSSVERIQGQTRGLSGWWKMTSTATRRSRWMTKALAVAVHCSRRHPVARLAAHLNSRSDSPNTGLSAASRTGHTTRGIIRVIGCVCEAAGTAA